MNDRPRGIFFIDLDGTLVGAGRQPDSARPGADYEHGVNDRVWGPLDALRAAGWRLAVCTGRPGRGIALDIARRFDPDGLHVFESGGAVLDTHGNVHESHPIEADAVSAIAALSTTEGATLEAYAANGRYLVPERDTFVASHETLLGFEAELTTTWPPPVPLVRLQWVVPTPRWPALRELALRPRSGSGAASAPLALVSAHEGRSPMVPDVSFISMTRRGISKATGMRTVLAALGLTPAEAAMAGDNHNDLDGLRLVGRAFVPVDGAEVARALAHHLIPGPSDGGVAEAAMMLASGRA